MMEALARLSEIMPHGLVWLLVILGTLDLFLATALYRMIAEDEAEQVAEGEES